MIRYFRQCQAVFLEANYCADMLASGRYPYHLQRRISGDEGHLSNAQALELFTTYKSPDLRLLILSHLSRNNNKPELVETIFNEHAGNTRIVVASRYSPTPVFSIDSNAIFAPAKTKGRVILHERQLSLF